MRERQINFRFYTPTLPKSENRNFAQILRAISAIPLASRDTKIEGGSMKLEDFQESKTMILGSLTHGRYDNIPGKAKFGEATTDLGITDDEYVTEMTTFVYASESNTLVFQSNIHGVSIGRFAAYIQQLAHLKGPIDFNQKLSKDAWKLFKRMKRVSSFEVDAKLPPKSARGMTGIESFDSLSELNDKYKGLKIRFEVSVGKSTSNSLDKEEILADAEDLMRRIDGNDAAIENLIVRGKGTRGKTERVNLVENFVRHTAKISPPKRRADFRTLVLAASQAYTAQKHLL